MNQINGHCGPAATTGRHIASQRNVRPVMGGTGLKSAALFEMEVQRDRAAHLPASRCEGRADIGAITLVWRWFPTPVRPDPIDRLVQRIRDLHHIQPILTSPQYHSSKKAGQSWMWQAVEMPRPDALGGRAPGCFCY